VKSVCKHMQLLRLHELMKESERSIVKIDLRIHDKLPHLFSFSRIDCDSWTETLGPAWVHVSKA
jgi:hypothetical protein